MYTDGSSESYYSLVVIDGASAELVYEYFTANKTLVETNINQPGKAYHSFLEMVGKVPNLTNSTVSRRRQLQPERSSNRRLQTDGSTQGDQSYSWYFLDTPKSAAFQITDEYAVLKIQDFDLEEDYVVTLWVSARLYTCKLSLLDSAILTVNHFARNTNTPKGKFHQGRESKRCQEGND